MEARFIFIQYKKVMGMKKTKIKFMFLFDHPNDLPCDTHTCEGRLTKVGKVEQILLA